jgi:hypothetical protein
VRIFGDARPRHRKGETEKPHYLAFFAVFVVVGESATLVNYSPVFVGFQFAGCVNDNAFGWQGVGTHCAFK